MGRVGLAVLLVVVGPALLVAQRVGVTALVGAYMQAPAEWSTTGGDICDGLPCASVYTNQRSSGPVVGGRVSIELTSRFGLDATLQAAATTSTEIHHSYEGALDPASIVAQADHELVTTFLLLQPSFRSRLSDVLDLRIAAGPGFLISSVSRSTYSGEESWSWQTPQSTAQIGLALSGAFRARVGGSLSFDLGVSNTYIFGEVEPRPVGGARSHLTVQAGAVLGL